MLSFCVTPHDFGAEAEDGSADESEALQAAINHALAQSRPLDLAGRTWRHDSSLVAPGDLILRYGTLLSGGKGVGLSIGHANGDYVRPNIRSVTFRKLQNTHRTGLRIVRGLGAHLSDVSFKSYRNGGCVGLRLEGCQVTHWFGGNCYENDQHLVVTDWEGKRSTDTKLFGVFLSDARVGPAIEIDGAPGFALNDCAVDISRAGPLLRIDGSSDISLLNSRFEKAGIDRGGRFSAIQLENGCRNIRLFGCYFSNTIKGGAGYPPVIENGDTQGLSLLANSFAKKSPVVANRGGWKALMNTGLADSPGS